ncbi:hypothetical protein HGRIS_004690 [Hohenbuehelia grisea]|uniref:Uncharacterized protein n=1 Tax=Hohenbuehelia grisea TaxID=104357 RepID=A0ABR3JCV4_9AGAR
MLPYDEPATGEDSLVNNRHSIDLTIDLEHQLNLESVPNTPADPHFAHQDARLSANDAKRDSLDPHVLASIIMQLRQSLNAMTKERDDLLAIAAGAQSKEAQLSDALQLMTDKCTSMEEELSEARKKTRDDEEAINMLRSKVEESRRGLMRLQTESRRQSTLPSPAPTPIANKRASFTPLALSASAAASPLPFGARGNSHRRISSVSDSGSPHAQALSFSDHDPSATMNPRFLSGLPFRGSPPRIEHTLSAPDIFASPEMESLRAEVKALKAELDETRAELTEAMEARDASETCANALREFITENNVGTSSQSDSLKLPPLPAISTGEEKATPTVGGWGFKLWKASTPTPQPASTPRVPHAPAPQPTVISPDTPSLSRKLGGFFSGRAAGATQSASPAASPDSERPRPQTENAPSAPRLSQQRNSGSSTSSMTDSVAEPISPASRTEDVTGVLVRDSTTMSVNSVGMTDEVSPTKARPPLTLAV